MKNKTFKITLLSLLIVLSTSFTKHKYYVSLCEIEYVKEEKSIQILLHIFIDDLEATLNKEQNKTLYLASTKEVKNVKEIYKSYLQKQVTIKINNTLEPYNYIGHEYDNDIAIFYLEIPYNKPINLFEIKNTCLFSTFNNQQNIIKLSIYEKQKTFYLTKKNSIGLLKL